MGIHNGEFCFAHHSTFSILNANGEEEEKDFTGGKYYHIDSITHYPDGYSDILFTDDTTLFQIILNEVGSYLGAPNIKHEKEALEGEIKERS